MPKSYNLPEIYDEACKLVGDEPFTEWVSGNNLCAGQLCEAAVWYEETYKWALEEAHYDQWNESKTTWYARKVQSGKIPPPGKYVKRYFSLSNGEVLITVNGKYRPVILIRRFESEWLYPGDRILPSWLALPLFTYKAKHTQLILTDAQLNTPERFYIPTMRGQLPGAKEECSVRFLTMQAVREEYLVPVKVFDVRKKMQRPYRLTATALKVLVYHLFKNLDLFSELAEQNDRYDLFREYVQELIAKGLKSS